MYDVKQKVMNVRNPRTGQLDYQMVPINPQQLEKQCTDLRVAQIEWQRLGVDGRINILKQWGQVIEQSREKLLAAVTIDTGRHRESIIEIDAITNWINGWSKIAEKEFMPITQITSIDFIEMESDYSAYPLVGIISPWNFPMALSLMDAIPALLAGCAVIIKPSEATPRFTEPLMDTIKQVPELSKVITYVLGAGETGAQLLEHIDMVCFTGSVATGQKVAVEAARRFIPAFLELGGKDPAIVTKSADIDKATSAILVGSVLGSGHQCYSLERIYVEETIMAEFVACLIKKASRLQLAYPVPESGEIGPLIFAPQADIIAEHLRDAVEKGAHIHCGGEIEKIGGGLWCRPTVITEVHHDMKLMKEETFGPIMSVMSFKDVKEAIRFANDTEFGLSAAVFAGTVDEAKAIARQIDAGGISINDTGLAAMFIGSEGKVEKTSFKSSGLGGSRLGSASIKRFVRKRALLYNTTSTRSPWWYEE
ncbi:aldehyde dehydrogenase [Sporosarcina sp. P3]|uniref:aldehyde dehydrogenase family protein n=1 Tax=Sporosarcina sp. P3 TaxID=2048245 RepID=UPI000C164FE7|nr:aldehyde dehydrogenase family protein [Sporosarcina sp. P3]PID20948.1 aldehyde dehydrogenase [Sporosarcina sp. P3]